MTIFNNSINSIKAQRPLEIEKENQTPTFSVLKYIPETQEAIENDIKSRLIEIAYPIKEKKCCKERINKITDHISQVVETISALENTQQVVDFKSDIAKTISKEINDIRLEYKSKNLNKKFADINVISEAIQIYFLYSIETKINKLQNQQIPDKIEFLRISKLVNLFKDSFNLSLEETTAVRYKINNFLANKKYINRLKSSFDKNKTNEFCNFFKGNYKNANNVFNNLFDSYTELLTSKKNILTLDSSKSTFNDSNKLSFDDLAIALNTMYFFASSKEHFIICDNLLKEIELVAASPTIKDTLKIIDQKFDEFKINDQYLIINYAEVNKTIESLVNTIENIKKNNANNKFINSTLYSYLFSKIDEHLNKIIDCNNLDTNLKVILLSHIINKCNSLGLTKNKKCEVITNLINHNKIGHSYNFSETLQKLVPEFKLEPLIEDIANTKKLKYSDKLLELLKIQSQNKTSIVLEYFNYAELLDVLNFEIADMQNLTAKQAKFNLTNIYEILFSRESKKNTVKQEEFLIKSILKFENILHEKLILNKSNQEFLSALDDSLQDNTTNLESFFNSLFESCKKTFEVMEIAKNQQITELYELISKEIFYKNIDILLNNLAHDETIGITKRLRYIDSINNALKNIFGEQYYLQRNAIIDQIKTAKLTKVNLNSIIQLDIKENAVIMQFYKKFNQLIKIATEEILEKCNAQEIEQSIQKIDSIYTEQTIKFLQTRNKSEQDLATAVASYRETVNDVITEVTQLTANNSINLTNLIEKNQQVTKAVVSTLDKFNNHYLKIAQIKDRASKIRAKNSFFMCLQLFFNSLCLLFENIKYKLFIITEIQDKSLRKLYLEISNELYNYQQKSVKASFMEKYFGNINMQQANIDANIANFSTMAYLFLNNIKDTIANKGNNTTKGAINKVANFIQSDGTNMNIFSCLSFLNLAVEKLLQEDKENFDEIDLIQAYYQLLHDFNGAIKQPQFLNNDTLLKFDKSYFPQVSAHAKTSNQNIDQLKWVAAKVLESVDSLEDKSKYTGDNFANFTVNINYEPIDNITKNSFIKKHKDNILLMKNILVVITPHITNENNLFMLNDSLNKLISIDAEYNAAKLTLELHSILQNIQESADVISSKYITDTANYLSQLVNEL